jgi:hypothetical protein
MSWNNLLIFFVFRWPKYGYLRANTDIEGKWPTLTSNYYWTCKNEHIATKYVINIIYMMDHFSSLNRDSSDFVTGFVTRETRRMSHVEHELLNSNWVYPLYLVRFGRFIILCEVFCIICPFVFFSFHHCIVCPVICPQYPYWSSNIRIYPRI